MVPQFTERYRLSFSASLCLCKAHGTLTYILKFLSFQVGPSWICCTLLQPSEACVMGQETFQSLFKLGPHSWVRGKSAFVSQTQQ